MVGSVRSLKDVLSWFLPCLSDFFLLVGVLGRVEAEKLVAAVFCRFAPTTDIKNDCS
jgi:hypothetical protein